MTQNDDAFGDLPDLSNRALLRVLMQEIADTRNELKQEFKQEFRRLDGRIDKVEKKIDVVASELHTLHIEVHQNQTACMANHAAPEKHITVLEMAAYVISYWLSPTQSTLPRSVSAGGACGRCRL